MARALHDVRHRKTQSRKPAAGRCGHDPHCGRCADHWYGAEAAGERTAQRRRASTLQQWMYSQASVLGGTSSNIAILFDRDGKMIRIPSKGQVNTG
ncbi:hypothetical protein WS84_09255 [Burkholderia anthina]|nr:hypothetical protein WS84_09255 [Burkholderia anthina]KVH14521.1 hypothetical protein WS85_08135 [Burkholderia anthina]KVM85383.1 hypothetical protein WT06_27785 [Burkholderia anthina]KVN52723.1 hypothetical protein WT13_29890 [Burkholderia anthina]KVX32666.1 hypothetical protein WT32_22250 [Burkholderia anthina]